MIHLTMRLLFKTWLCGTVTLITCGPSYTGGENPLPPLTILAVEPSQWLLGTRVTIFGTGFIGPDMGTMTATIQGVSDGKEVSVRVDLETVASDRAKFVVTAPLLPYLAVDRGPIEGFVVIERFGPSGVSDIASIPVAIRVVSVLEPVLETVGPVDVFPGEEITLTGSGFLMPGEGNLDDEGKARSGTTWVRLTGRTTGTEPKEVRGLAIPLTATKRHHATFRLTPEMMGLGPFEFEGFVEVSNVFAGETGSLDVPGNRLDGVTFRMHRTRLTGMAPAVVRRGQELTFYGNGFLPADTGTTTFIAFTGSQVGADGESLYDLANPLVFVPDIVEGNTIARQVIRPSFGPNQRPRGLGAKRATLSGIFTPHVVFQGLVVAGVGIQATLEVGRQVQVVWVRFLPSFEDGLDLFGLRAVADRVKEQAIAVCAADYRDFSVEFRTTVPQDYVEFVTVEVMARDPNEAGLFGLDNSFGKDEGNQVFDEVVGGYNARSARAGFYPYGGVFVESFASFSPQLAHGIAAEFASEVFDAVFAPVMPALGGRPARKGEDEVGGSRGAAVAEAIRVLGNLLGDTITHEVGHALGLAAVEGDVHNPGDNPGFIMDSGVFRAFEERAQMPGAHPRVFAPYDRAYLEEILPLD